MIGHQRLRQRVSVWWYDLQDSLWFVPTILTVCAALLALGMIRVDEAIRLDERQRFSIAHTWAFGGGAEGARGVLTSISGTMITVIGVVFSLTVVSLQLASSQFTPRVLRTFTGDRGNQLVLGVFISTFTYSLLVLRSIRSESESGESFVPAISVTVAIVMAMISVGFLIYYIHHITRSIQAGVIIDRAKTDTLAILNEVFPAEDDGSRSEPPPLPEALAYQVRMGSGGYVQRITVDVLKGLATDDETGIDHLVVRIHTPVGGFLMPDAPLASIWPASAGRAVEEQIRAAVAVGMERTLQTDIDLGVRQLADIALKSLSPGINDPTTATMCVDRMGEVLVEVGRRPDRSVIRCGPRGQGVVIVPGPTFESLTTVAFDQIRHYGAADVTMMAHLMTTLRRVMENVPPGRHDTLIAQARLGLQAAREGITLPEDVARVERAAAWLDDASPISPDGLVRANSAA
ncbi:MAG: DUF2254 domain-containing protein [Thermomicrobiales bacterium]